MSLLVRNFSKLNPLGSIRSYSEVVNVFGRRSVDTQAADEKKTIATIPENTESVKEVSGHPEVHLTGRLAKIYVPPKNSMQSGTFGTRRWRIDFDNRDRWENPLMGWGSSGDPLSSLQPEFGSKEDAIVYCQRMGFRYVVEEEREIKRRIKSYGANYSWNKRTRVSTK
ncbi:unnamed protein product [Brachionus calyciflorus]|uniref:NADH dehydrogenase [ubiquinone] iron-sulfur protein 4, mitochondrial n=1 Tax=Brachionus calyciflorus TaxID=104777 RepID=A0A813LZR0_9BILA|nr:unnamed protein product [Brachionus calyciflorus]